MKIGIPKEIYPGENRVATTPEAAEKIIKLGFEVYVQSGAGIAANITDAAYQQAGVSILDTAQAIWETADIILKIRAPQRSIELGLDELGLIKNGQTIISFIWPAQNPDLMDTLAAKNCS